MVLEYCGRRVAHSEYRRVPTRLFDKRGMVHDDWGLSRVPLGSTHSTRVTLGRTRGPVGIRRERLDNPRDPLGTVSDTPGLRWLTPVGLNQCLMLRLHLTDHTDTTNKRSESVTVIQWMYVHI